MLSASLSGVVQLAVVGRLRMLHRKTQPGTIERAQASIPVLYELEHSLDSVIFGIGLDSVLMIGRLTHKDLPSSGRLRSLYRSFKNKVHSDPEFKRLVVDTLPQIAAQYHLTSNNIINGSRNEAYHLEDKQIGGVFNSNIGHGLNSHGIHIQAPVGGNANCDGLVATW